MRLCFGHLLARAVFTMVALVLVHRSLGQEPSESDPFAGLDEGRAQSVRSFAGGEADLLLFRRLYELRWAGYLPKEKARKYQEALTSIPEWQDKLWRRIAEVTEQGELTKAQLDEMYRKLRAIDKKKEGEIGNTIHIEREKGPIRADLVRRRDARVLLGNLLKPLGYLGSEEAAYLVFPLLDSPAERIPEGDITISVASEYPMMVLSDLARRGVKFKDPFPLDQGYHAQAAWMERNKQTYGRRYRLPYLTKAVSVDGAVIDPPERVRENNTPPFIAQDHPSKGGGEEVNPADKRGIGIGFYAVGIAGCAVIAVLILVVRARPKTP